MAEDSMDTRPRPVALFIHSMGGGGAERVMLGIAAELAKRGVLVDLVLNRASGEFIELVPDSVRVIDLNTRRTVVSFLRFIGYLGRDRPSVVISALLGPNVVTLAAKMLFRGNPRVLVRQDTTLSDAFTNNSFRNRMMWRVFKCLLPVAEDIISVSQGVADDLRAVIPSVSHKVITIYNPVVWPDNEEEAAVPVGHPWFNDSTTPVVLSVGRLAPQKEFTTLLRAFAQVVACRPARLVILGEGPERLNLCEYAESLGITQYVDMPGFRVNPLAYMSKSNVFALSSRFEGLPTVLIEAMACGTPVVSTDCRSGPGEILEGGKWGHLVPVGDWRAMAEAILDSLDNPIPSDQLIARASAFSADAAIDRYLEVLTGISNSPSQ